jgi:phage-related protein
VATFPSLKTGAVAQYPSDRQQNFSTQVFRFLDGTEQRFPGYGATLRRWVIRLDLLDESELTALEVFFVSEGGRAGLFSFTDPFDSTVYASCSFDADELDLTFGGPQAGQATVTIREVSGA